MLFLRHYLFKKSIIGGVVAGAEDLVGIYNFYFIIGQRLLITFHSFVGDRKTF